jgi:cysteine desulfurase
MTEPIYFDYAATTPVDPQVAAAMSECLGKEGDFANPASAAHGPGRRAHARVERAREEVAALIGAAPSEIVFTSGATESNNLAVLGVARANAHRGRHIVSSRIEHRAVLDPCRQLEKEGFSVTYLEPDSAGRLSLGALAGALRSDTVLVSVMLVNNEIGVVQDMGAIAALCRARDIAVHTDAAQAAGKLPIDVRAVGVDFMSLTAHKLYGPKGVGALYIRTGSRGKLTAVSYGGGQERGLRPGTLATHQIVGFGVACALAYARADEPARIERLRDRLWSGISNLGGMHLNGATAARIPGILSVSVEGMDGESLITGLTELALSTGSACSSATGEPSYVLRALGRSRALAQSTLRFSLGRGTDEADIDVAVAALGREITRLRAVSPAAVYAQIAADTPEITDNRVNIESDSLSPEVRQLFTDLPGAGTLAGVQGVVHGEAGSVDQDAWVRFHLQIADGVVKDARFQAYGCPHTLAVAAWLTQKLPGRPVSAVAPSGPSDWARALAVPVEKLGRLLIVEDALHTCVMSAL